MPANIEELNETQTDIDTSEALAEISSDLFGQGGDEETAGAKSAEGEGAPSSGEPSAVEQKEPSPQTGEEAKPVEGETSTEVQETGAPKTWSKEALKEWATVPPRAQQEIMKREEDFLRGITQYRERADLGSRYDSVVEPFRPVLAAENIDPVQLFQSFAANHYLLSRGTPQQKIELAANLIQGYNIDFEAVADFVGNRVIEPADPRVAALERELAEIKGGLNRQQEAALTQTRTRIESEVEAFATDPAHPHFNELTDDIAKLMESGLATSLQDAYDKAVFSNPVTRAKELERLTAVRQASVTAEEQARRNKIAKATAADVNVTPASRNGTVPVGSIDDTLTETLRAIQARS